MKQIFFRKYIFQKSLLKIYFTNKNIHWTNIFLLETHIFESNILFRNILKQIFFRKYIFQKSLLKIYFTNKNIHWKNIFLLETHIFESNILFINILKQIFFRNVFFKISFENIFHKYGNSYKVGTSLGTAKHTTKES